MRAKRPPTRSCVVCRSARDKRELLRVVRTPGGEVVFDASGKAPGRGAYVCRDAACVNAGIDKKRLQAALDARISEEAALQLRQAIEESDQEGEVVRT